MDIKERILDVLKNELDPFGYRYVKSESKFKRKVNKDTIVYLYYNASQYHRGFTTVSFYANGEYRDLKKAMHNQCIIENIKYWHFHFGSRLQWLMPEGSTSSIWDLAFHDNETETVVNERLQIMALCIRTYAIPFMERLSHRSSALEEAIALDKRFLLVSNKYIIPIMYCLWAHDKKAALEYLEDREQRLRRMVKPEEWQRLEQMKNGETIAASERPTSALSYEEYVEKGKEVKAWIESQNYD